MIGNLIAGIGSIVLGIAVYSSVMYAGYLIEKKKEKEENEE